MSKANVRKVIGKIMSDEDFARRVRDDPDATLEDFDLTDAERDALRDIDVDKIESTDINIGRDLDTNMKRIGAAYWD